MARFMLFSFSVIFLVNYTLGAPSKQQSPKADCETCNWKYDSDKLSRYRNGGAVLDRCIQPGTIALTFDDGPTVTTTPAVLDVLKAENVTATFFVNGENYWPPLDHADARAVLRRTRDEGHYIGSHTWSHHYLISQTTQVMQYEMNQLSDKVLEILDERPTVMRPPYGKFNDTVIDLVYGQMGYKMILWSICPCDWEYDGNPEMSLAEYKAVLDGTDPMTTLGFISLHHDPLGGSADLTSKVIQYVRSIGYRFVGLDECLGLPSQSK